MPRGNVTGTPALSKPRSSDGRLGGPLAGVPSMSDNLEVQVHHPARWRRGIGEAQGCCRGAEAWSKAASGWTRTGCDDCPAGRAGQRPRNPGPSRTGMANPAAVPMDPADQLQPRSLLRAAECHLHSAWSRLSREPCHGLNPSNRRVRIRMHRAVGGVESRGFPQSRFLGAWNGPVLADEAV